MCRNDELSSTMSWVGCLLTDSELFVLFAENSQIFLKISGIPIILTFTYLVALESVGKQPTQLIVQLNSSLRQTIDSIIAAHKWHIALSFHRSKLFCSGPISFGQVQIILGRFKLDFSGLICIILTGPKWFGPVQNHWYQSKMILDPWP